MIENSSDLIMIFENSGKTFGLELDHVERVIEKEALTPVPMAPPAAKGIVFYRDNVLPVLNLLKLLDIDGKGEGDLLVIVRGVSEDFGVFSDRIYGIIPADLLELEDIPFEKRENGYIQGTGKYNGIEFSLLDFLKLEI
ncbi:MAG TPA: chemotaxis protein CheW [Thermodesulfobacteriota bacterium]|nr:chemotaxis protein CheW [Thermodesulfobacteriota bacterium]